MNGRWKMICVPMLGAAVLLSACGNQNYAGDNDNAGMQPEPMAIRGGHVHDTRVIPSYNGPKTETTNETGHTASGMGMNVYSLIGSSGLHEGGISSHIRSRLTGDGIEGVRVFVLDDTVILAQEKTTFSADQYDNLQAKVLSHTAGLSGKGAVNEGPHGTTQGGADSLTKAKNRVKSMFGGGEVKVLTVTNPQAFDLLDSITAKLQASRPDKTVADDISRLLDMASEK
ncbi:hypothetical protein [Paenibacillus thermotolerans]|uniref:hypothetical protein n=1 Tax=Paenibacillus thermotolerans TaxID=3027807 RepID=UPI00236807DF|nr:MULTISPECIES: hypothetical protein [unclassified Paenibacillus]